MGLSGISPLSLLLILVIIIALFGTSKLKTIGTDLGEAIRNFRNALNDNQANEPSKEDNKPS
ncbi:twin-arginine translocase TatA/TatE family subunit [Legionella qingyii]|uniref:Sec-independent protein translocase protein TatA n=1 Tax=Legionella qingyii TaxID=2184757 RepID=A0A317U232_9GAMM|nr:twin-arginine translocase TatA/TatE family subunit [Legionella qingyii]PWY55768.1 twin-arginine translocase TatA/TatE family subunit [Legionella qingyii]PWY56104.1 twin-arginine translocase TatA/TatE family subunit [Legionella qingyii]RUR23136.1 twin-arginine translocase TatA/TatE family subunit [Legionella qingyii]RUR26981.1 twin-arginine translocase TatA/TatE family subunit [Legionella qingyii]